jgi:hypothetical protein
MTHDGQVISSTGGLNNQIKPELLIQLLAEIQQLLVKQHLIRFAMRLNNDEVQVTLDQHYVYLVKRSV